MPTRKQRCPTQSRTAPLHGIRRTLSHELSVFAGRQLQQGVNAIRSRRRPWPRSRRDRLLPSLSMKLAKVRAGRHGAGTWPKAFRGGMHGFEPRPKCLSAPLWHQSVTPKKPVANTRFGQDCSLKTTYKKAWRLLMPLLVVREGTLDEAFPTTHL